MQETKDIEAPDGLYCFLNPERACGADCMAYETPPNYKDFIGKQWARCVLLVNAHRVGKHLPILAGSLGTLVTQEQDKARMPQPPPPVR